MVTSKYGCIVHREKPLPGAISDFISMIRNGNSGDLDSHSDGRILRCGTAEAVLPSRWLTGILASGLKGGP